VPAAPALRELPAPEVREEVASTTTATTTAIVSGEHLRTEHHDSGHKEHAQ